MAQVDTLAEMYLKISEQLHDLNCHIKYAFPVAQFGGATEGNCQNFSLVQERHAERDKEKGRCARK